MIVSVSPVGFQSTHSLRSATKTPSYFVYDDYVSIHALLAECDYTQPACPPRSGVSIHALLAECDILPTGEIAPLVKFQSTHSLRSATGAGWSRLNPLIRFQSTHSLRSATYSCLELVEAAEVSIHALLAECDSGGNGRALTDESFNPRTPCGVRPSLSYHSKLCTTFQSTHSLRSATLLPVLTGAVKTVSIHALLAECDSGRKLYYRNCYKFQSTHSLRSATFRPIEKRGGKRVSIHALLAECDLWACAVFRTYLLFQSTHSLRSATFSSVQRSFNKYGFNPRTPCGVRPPQR